MKKIDKLIVEVTLYLVEFHTFYSVYTNGTEKQAITNLILNLQIRWMVNEEKKIHRWHFIPLFYS